MSQRTVNRPRRCVSTAKKIKKKKSTNKAQHLERHFLLVPDGDPFLIFLPRKISSTRNAPWFVAARNLEITLTSRKSKKKKKKETRTAAHPPRCAGRVPFSNAVYGL